MNLPLRALRTSRPPLTTLPPRPAPSLRLLRRTPHAQVPQSFRRCNQTSASGSKAGTPPATSFRIPLRNPSGKLSDFSPPKGKLSDFSAPSATSQFRAELPTFREILRRLVSREYYNAVWREFRAILKPLIIFELMLASTLLAMHAAIVRYEEDESPTTTEWRYWTRYSALRSRIWNPLFPWGEEQSAEDIEYWLDEALKGVSEELVAKGGLEKASEDFKRELIKLRIQRSEFYRKKKMDYVKEREELEEALKIDLAAEDDFIQERMQAAARLANICEWENDSIGAFEALQKAIAISWPGALKDGRVPVPPSLPPPGSPLNTNELLDAVTELAVYLSRHGQLAPALEILTQVLVRREAGPMVFDPTVKRAGLKISDPCKKATTMAAIGELMFALGKRNDGIAWEQKAFEAARWLAEMRGQCNKCSDVAAKNLIRMGEIIRDEGGNGKGKGGWLWSRKSEEFTAEEGAALAEEYLDELRHLKRIRVVKDEVTN